MTGRYHAYVIDDDGDFKVRPSVATVDRLSPLFEDGVAAFTIRNLTAFPVIVSFPAPRRPVPDAWLRSPRAGLIAPGAVGIISLRSLASGAYRYQVVLQNPRGGGPLARARGESGPRLVVDP